MHNFKQCIGIEQQLLQCFDQKNKAEKLFEMFLIVKFVRGGIPSTSSDETHCRTVSQPQGRK